jgi:hypothetical protein
MCRLMCRLTDSRFPRRSGPGNFVRENRATVTGLVGSPMCPSTIDNFQHILGMVKNMLVHHGPKCEPVGLPMAKLN